MCSCPCPCIQDDTSQGKEFTALPISFAAGIEPCSGDTRDLWKLARRLRCLLTPSPVWQTTPVSHVRPGALIGHGTLAKIGELRAPRPCSENLPSKDGASPDTQRPSEVKLRAARWQRVQPASRQLRHQRARVRGLSGILPNARKS